MQKDERNREKDETLWLKVEALREKEDKVRNKRATI